MDDKVFATVDDYAARYGTPDNEGLVTALLVDASALMLSAYERHYREPYGFSYHPAFERSARAVCCAVAARAANTQPDSDGLSNLQMTAGSYSQSFTFGSTSSTRARLWPSDLKDLGLAGCVVGSVAPMVGERDSRVSPCHR